ncbi:MAG: alpha/beta hydrolase fold domain-containing protein [Phycisphaerales bacterium]|nr:alpha/beta hydrolase fold domain-containing protein [Phycisphaerales bacterium]
MRTILLACLGMLTINTVASGAELSADLPYESPGSTEAFLDVYRPDDGLLAGVPTILFIHGGAWYAGDKTEAPELLNGLADAGYGVVSGNYTRSSPEHSSYPQVIHDIKAIIRWIRTEGATLGLSPTIIATGPSAGGHLSQMMLTSNGVEIFEPLAPPIRGYQIQAAVPFWGLSDLVEQAESMGSSGPLAWFLGDHYHSESADLYAEASPITWASADDGPVHQVHGLTDPLHPWRQSHFLHKRMLDLDVPSEVMYFNGGHGFDELGGQNIAVQILLENIPELLASGRTADLNWDDSVDVADLMSLIDSWGTCPDLPIDCPADLDADGSVGVNDLLFLLRHYNPA